MRPWESDDGLLKIIAAGSGSGDFFWDEFGPPTKITGGTGSPTSLDIIKKNFTRFFGEMIFRETSDLEHFHKRYGGAYEICCFNGTAGTMELVPFRIDLFSKIGNLMGHEGSYFFHYAGGEFFTIRMRSLPAFDEAVADEDNYRSDVQIRNIKSVVAERSGVIPFDIQAVRPVWTFRLATGRGSFSFGQFDPSGLRITLAPPVGATVYVSREFIDWSKKTAQRLGAP